MIIFILKTPTGEGNDKLRWCLKGSGKIDTRSFYHAIGGVNSFPFPWKGIWSPKIPRGVVFSFCSVVAHVVWGGGGCASVIWDSLGHARVGYEFIILLEKLAWEAWFGYLELNSGMLDVDCSEGTESPLVR